MGRLFKAGCLLTFSAFRMGSYLRWVLIRGWALIRINMVITINENDYNQLLHFIDWVCWE